jgi:hypothetical protein
MKTNLLVLTIILYGCFSAYSQDYAFKVLVNKGKNEVKSGNAWLPIKTGVSLKKDDEVKLENNAYLGLVHVTGKPLELKQAGNYKVIDLAAKVSGGTSVLNKYTDFILSSNTEKKNKLSATGAVHRGEEGIHVYLPKPEFSVVYNKKVAFSWQKRSAPYIVLLKSMFGDDLVRVETSDTTYSIDLSDPKFANEDNILVDVYPKAEPGKKQDDPPYVLKKLSKADKERIKNLLHELGGLPNEHSALNKLIMAGFYEQNKLIIDAGTAYLEAIRLAPDVVQYQEDYKTFLLRNGLEKPDREK